MSDKSNSFVRAMRCTTCHRVYPISIGYPAKAPHGPNQDCHGKVWERVEYQAARSSTDHERTSLSDYSYKRMAGSEGR